MLQVITLFVFEKGIYLSEVSPELDQNDILAHLQLCPTKLKRSICILDEDLERMNQK